MSNLSENLKTVRVAIYVRVSTHYQVDRDSLPLQKEDLTNYAKYVLNADSYEIFEDAGFSVKNTDRPDYQKMMARVRQGEFTHILVWKLDRISRNLLDFSAMYEELKSLGVTFISKNEQFDTSTAMGEAMLKIILVFAELERKMTAERVTAVMLSRAGNGQRTGAPVPYGYSFDKETQTFSIVEKEAAVVRQMYDLYESTHSILCVAKALKEAGILSRKGKEWGLTSISYILKNPFYVGTYHYNQRDVSKRHNKNDIKPEAEWIIIPNHHPAIIEPERQQAIIKRLARNQKDGPEAGKTYTRKNVHIFAGLLTCGICGGNMAASLYSKPLKDGYQPSVYACIKHRRGKGCANPFVSDTKIGPFALNYIANMIRARESFGKSTKPETLEKKLLRGEMFSEVKGIKEAGLMELYEIYKSEVDGVSYQPKLRAPAEGETERDLLLAERRRIERALDRLKSLYLFSEKEVSESEYILERNELIGQLEKVNAQLDALSGGPSSEAALTDEAFLEKASYFLLSQKLLDKRFVDYKKLLKECDPRILKDFINSVTSNFCIKNGRIVSITFKNGMIHEFIYKDE